MSHAGRTEFGAPWGKALKIISASVSTLLIGVAALGLVRVEDAVGRMLMMAVPLLLLPACALFIVRGYTLRGETLLVRRLLWSTEISLAGIQSAAHDPEAIRGSIRLFGNGGLFSFTGIFRNKRLGIYRAYVNDLKRVVVLKLRDRTVVISPEDPEEFVRAVRQQF